MTQEGKKRLTGLVVGLVVLGSFLTGLLGMMFSEKNREYFIHKIKNIKNIPFMGSDRNHNK